MCGIVLPCMIILGILPVGLLVAYEGGAFSLTGRVFFLPVRFRGKRDTSGPERDILSRLRKLYSHPSGKIFLKNAYTTLKRLIPRVWIPHLKLRFVAAGEDPANTALLYGAAGTAFEQLRTITADRVRRADIRVEVDFRRLRPEIAGCVLLCLHLYELVWYGLCFALGVRRDYRRQRRGV